MIRYTEKFVDYLNNAYKSALSEEIGVNRATLWNITKGKPGFKNTGDKIADAIGWKKEDVYTIMLEKGKK